MIFKYEKAPFKIFIIDLKFYSYNLAQKNNQILKEL